MLVDAGRDRLQLQRQAAFLEQPDPAQAPVVRARDRRQRLIRLASAAVERDLDGKWWPLL